MKGYDFFSSPRQKELDAALEKFPEMPPLFIFKTDICRRGVTFTKEAIEKVQDPYYEHTPHLLFQWHHKDHTEDFGVPISLIFSDGGTTGLSLSPSEYDPYTIGLLDDKFWVFSDEKPLVEVDFQKRPDYYDKRTSSGELMQNIMEASGDNWCIIPYKYCNYWKEDLQCRFCDISYNCRHQLKMGRLMKTRISPEDLYEATVEALKEKGRWRHTFFTGGSQPENKFSDEVDYYCDLFDSIMQAGKEAGHDRLPNYIIAAPLNEEDYIQMKEHGLEAYGPYLEIWDHEKFKLQCPGKEKYVGWQEWIDKTKNAIKVFGRGNVCCNFVQGVETAPPPYGFEELDDAVNSALEGIEFMCRNDIVPIAINWSIMPGSDFYKLGAIPAPLEFFVRVDLGRGKIIREYDLPTGVMCYRHQPFSRYVDYQRFV